MGPGREGASTKPKAVIQEAVVAVGRQPAVGSEAPSQSLPEGQRDSLAPGRALPPHQEGGTDPAQSGTQGSGARQLANGCGRGRGCQAGCSVPANQERWDMFPWSAADQPAGRPASQPWPALLLPLPPAPGQAQLPPPRPWPGAQLGPGGQSYCKRPGRPQAWTLPAGHGHRHLPLPGLAS